MTAQTFFAVLCVLQVLDAVTTYQGLKRGAGEANPLMRGAIKAFGVKGGLFAMKAAILAFVWFNPVSELDVQVILILIYVLTIAHNLKK